MTSLSDALHAAEPEVVPCIFHQNGDATAIDGLASDPTSKDWDNPTWTRHVKNAVGGVGRDRKYWICASGSDHANEGEWLYDLLWLEYDGSNLTGAPLVLESEWDPGGLEDDFLKLARADHRVFVFDTSPGADRRTVIDNLLRSVRTSRHTISGDRYLFGVWNQRPEALRMGSLRSRSRAGWLTLGSSGPGARAALTRPLTASAKRGVDCAPCSRYGSGIAGPARGAQRRRTWMAGSSAKQKVLEAIEKLPADATLEDAIERLVLLAKIERGLAELDAGRGVDHTEAKR